MGIIPASGENRPGLAVPKRERRAIAEIMGWVGVGTSDVDGAGNGRVVARYREGWLDDHLWQGLHMPQPVDGVRHLVHGWSGQTLSSGEPVRQYSGMSKYDFYDDGDVRVVTVPLPEGEVGVGPEQLSDAFGMLREFAERQAPQIPARFDAEVYGIADNLPTEALRGAARWMLDNAVAMAGVRTAPVAQV